MDKIIFILFALLFLYIFVERIWTLVRKRRLYKIRLTKDWIGNYYIEYKYTPISQWYFYVQVSADSDSEAVERFAEFINKEKISNPHFKDTIICEKIIKQD